MSPIEHISSSALEPNEYISLPSGQLDYFSVEECARIIELSTTLPDAGGRVDTANDVVVVEEVRRSTIKWMYPVPDTQWVFDKIAAAVSEVNKTYNYDLSGYKTAQVAQYSLGGHYTWHTDLGSGGMSNRKLSVSVQLSDPADYDGGGLEFMSVGGIRDNPPRKQGAVIIFPSFVPHRIAPVTRGVRWSMVTWIYGRPFR